MKNKIVSKMIALLFIVLATACSKDDKVNGGVKENYLKVKIDGREKNFPDVRARWIEAGNFLEITASENGSEWVTITVMSETTRVPAGQYSLDDGSAFTILSTHTIINNNAQLNHAATRGTAAREDAFSLKIDKIDNGSVEGSFSGVLVRVEGLTTLGTVTLTEGQFKAAIEPN
jgi:hypothetical protein